jgi:hypothetical protein
MSGDDQTLEVRHRPHRAVLLLLISLVFVVGAVWLLMLEGDDASPDPGRHRWAYPWIMWGAIIFFGPCALFLARAIFDRRSQVTISRYGIRYRRWSRSEIPWSEITSAEVKFYRGNSFVTLHLRDPGRYPGHGILAWLAGANRAMGFGDLVIATATLDHSAEEILAAIERYSGKAR